MRDFGTLEHPVMAAPAPLLGVWVRLRSAWSRNDGKPREEWAAGRDLKELVLVVLLVVVVAALIGLVAYSLVGSASE